jgi:predicted MPP superfamily phosphohydrolase
MFRIQATTMSVFTLASLAGLTAVVALAALARGRQYATFLGVLLGIHTLSATALFPHAGIFRPAYVWAHAAVYVHFALLARPRMRPWPYRALVSVPASYFVAATLLAVPWAILAGVGLRPWGLLLPYVAAAVGLLESLIAREEVVDVALDGAVVPGLKRHPRGSAREPRPLRVVQITDPHLGAFMSPARLRRICERAVAREPDLVLLTGDFLTMESQHDARDLAHALAPLRPLAGRTFACMGNHDHEAPEVVAEGLRSAGVALLIDAAATVQTPAGPVEVLGFDFRWSQRQAHLAAVCAAHPRTAGLTRIALLHDPGAFRHLPEGAADLVLSGHTHGGQLGLLRFGLPHTIVSAMTPIPDHGLWARGADRLYVHRGTGHYGFPIRLGVPAEQSVLQLHRVGAATAGAAQ